jgi:hypothetical protein
MNEKNFFFFEISMGARKILKGGECPLKKKKFFFLKDAKSSRGAFPPPPKKKITPDMYSRPCSDLAEGVKSGTSHKLF